MALKLLVQRYPIFRVDRRAFHTESTVDFAKFILNSATTWVICGLRSRHFKMLVVHYATSYFSKISSVHAKLKTKDKPRRYIETHIPSPSYEQDKYLLHENTDDKTRIVLPSLPSNLESTKETISLPKG